MNIFWLDTDLELCAKYHCDKHVVKMILESAQILSSVLHKIGLEAPYRLTHQNHPCTIWAAKHRGNYRKLYNLLGELHREYQHRYGQKTHKSYLLVESGEIPHPDTLDAALFGDNCEISSPAPNCTDIKEYPLTMSIVDLYRCYYIRTKAKTMSVTYTNREIPAWLGEDFMGDRFYRQQLAALGDCPGNKTQKKRSTGTGTKRVTKDDLLKALPFELPGLKKLKVSELQALTLVDFASVPNIDIPEGRLKAPYISAISSAIDIDVAALTVADIKELITIINNNGVK